MHAHGLSLLLILLTLLSARVSAHEGTHEQILALTAAIEAEPTNARLYWERGELYRTHRNWDDALSDFAKAGELDPDLFEVDLGRARLYQALGYLHAAEHSAARYLLRVPHAAEAHRVRAELLVAIGRPRAGADAYTAALALPDGPTPEIYVARALALVSAGEPEQALGGLDEGLVRYGSPVVALQLLAIEIELEQERTDAALLRLEILSTSSPRQETWHARRGDILEGAGRLDEARHAYQQALAAIATLPPPRRRVDAMSTLESQLKVALERLKGGVS